MNWNDLPEQKRTTFEAVYSDYARNPENEEARSNAQRVTSALMKNGVSGMPDNIVSVMQGFSQPQPTPAPTPSGGPTLESIKSKFAEGGDAPSQPRSALDVAGEWVGKGGAAVMGAAEALNPLSMPRPTETLIRAVPKWAGSEEVTDELSGGVAPIYKTKGPSFLESMAEAEKESVIPPMTYRSLGEAIHGKEAMEGMPESWEIAGSLAMMAVPGGKGALRLLKGSKAREGAKLSKEVMRDVKFLTGEGEGIVMEQILKNPEAVRTLYQSGNIKAVDLAEIVVSRLKGVQKKLIGRTEKLRKVAESDRVGRITSKPFKDELKGVLAAERADPKITLVPTTKKSAVLDAAGKPIRVDSTKKIVEGGETALKSTDIKEIEKVMNFLVKDKVSPRDALLAIKRLDDAIDWGTETKKHSQAAISAFKRIRHNLKEAVRKTTPDAETWAKTDDVFHQFLEDSKGIEKHFSGDQKVSKVNTLLNETRDPYRVRLGKALDAASKIDPDAKDVSRGFFRMLAQRNGARMLKEMEISGFDRNADQANRIFQRWLKRGETIGLALGSTTGTLIGHKLGGLLGGIMGSGPGAYIGKLGGSILGEVVGKSAGNPLKLLKRAERAKTLSREAKALAGDLKFFHTKFGQEAANIAFAIGYELPAMKELTRWASGAEGREVIKDISNLPSTFMEVLQ